ncbi:peptide-methionine (S)-S-oxide reductase [Lentisphaera profundi]|uniref:peptide-methionine (S)-S-oxide reductase n=1 Tax=Lentisphaera profundi TaxID=1658616 RepID=A0ABY7VZX5_9BACT|nr:peptide-methionine (S)-S-oxide reductase [Lentisphaera profundi]WDE99262.1 peptide-methionine (S)-S-oxide reductase [Lentisphaera profundi]
MLKIFSTVFIVLSLLLSCAEEYDNPTLMISSGCFWNVQSFMQSQQGVQDTKCGYTGGTTTNPTYENARKNGHVEAVEVSLEKGAFLKVARKFFSEFPAKRIKAKNDMFGKDFRGRIYYFNLEQKAILENLRKQYDAENTLTLILPASEFYIAEDYHQDWLKKRCAKN